MSTWPSLWSKKLGTPNDPAIRFTRGTDFVATMVRNCYGLSGCSPPWTDLTVNHFGHRGLLLPGFRQVRSPLPPLDITTTVTGLLCWQDSHPLEWQLASLHWSGRAPSPSARAPTPPTLTARRRLWFSHCGSPAALWARSTRTPSPSSTTLYVRSGTSQGGAITLPVGTWNEPI